MKEEAMYRIIWGWSAYEDHDDLEVAKQRADELADSTLEACVKDSLLRMPTVYEREGEEGYFTAVVYEPKLTKWVNNARLMR